MAKFTHRQILYKRYRIEGMGSVAAAIKAGYSPAMARSGKVQKVCDLSLEMEMAGVTSRRIAEKLSREIDNEDASIAHKYLETALKVTGRLNPQTSVNIEKSNVVLYLPEVPQNNLT